MLGVRIDEKMDKRLAELAKKYKRSKSYFAREAIELHLEEIADYEEALERSRNPNAKYISDKDMRKRLGL
jgi:RHH-type rel operon transcriptional repressor/antitoxin RelB